MSAAAWVLGLTATLCGNAALDPTKQDQTLVWVSFCPKCWMRACILSVWSAILILAHSGIKVTCLYADWLRTETGRENTQNTLCLPPSCTQLVFNLYHLRNHHKPQRTTNSEEELQKVVRLITVKLIFRWQKEKNRGDTETKRKMGDRIWVSRPPAHCIGQFSLCLSFELFFYLFHAIC